MYAEAVISERDQNELSFQRVLEDLQALADRQNTLTLAEQKVLDLSEAAAEDWRHGTLTDEQLMEALEQARHHRTIDGVDFSAVQISQVVNHGEQLLEIETFSPYLCDYDMKHGTIWSDNLVPSDRTGLQVGQVFAEMFPDARFISLYDEYNSSIPGNSDERGVPTPEGAQYAFPPEVQATFKNSVAAQLRGAGIIAEDAEEGQDYILVSESSKVEHASQLVERLEQRGFIERNGEEISFVNPTAENPLYRHILLRSSSGRWMCEALDAASYLDPINLEIMHLIVLPQSMREQQDKVWEILRVLGIAKLNYHNIFYDEGIDPQAVAETIRREFNRFR